MRGPAGIEPGPHRWSAPTETTEPLPYGVAFFSAL